MLGQSNTKEGADEPCLDVKQVRLVHIVAVGLSARMFLTKHFQRLRSEGFLVTLVCSGDKDARFCATDSGVMHIPVSIKQHVSPFSDIFSVFQLWRVLRRLRPTIVHTHMAKAGLLGAIAGRLAGVPIRIYHNHGMSFLSARGWRRWFLKIIDKVACRFATNVLYCAPSNLDDAVANGLVSRKKGRVLGPGTIRGIDIEAFDPEAAHPRAVTLRRNAGVPEDSWIVGFVARIVPHKGIETILDAWRLLPGSIRQRAYLCIFGSFGHPRMQRLVEQAVAVSDLHVRYMGFSTDMPAWYSAMTVLVQPSWHEGWGYNVLEAACCGTPAVGTRISATVDAILDGKTGLLVPVKTPKAMAKAIVRLLTDEALRERLGKAARERTINEFAQETIIPLLGEEYRRLLSQRVRSFAKCTQTTV